MTSLIKEFGVLGVFFLMVPEAACIPIPSELTLLFSGFAVRQGWMSFPLAVAAATGGNLVGSLIAYAVGASGVLAAIPVANRIVGRWQEPIERHGERAILYARVLPLARTFVALPAGARRVRLVPFIQYTVLGSAVWALGFITTGLLVGTGWQQLDSVLGRVLLVLGLLGAVVMFHRAKQRRRRDSR